MRGKVFFCLGVLLAAPTICHTAADRPTLFGSLEPSEESTASAADLRQVVRVVDGDTIVISPNEKVRLIGVDAPESVHPKQALACFGREAKQFTRNSVEGKNVRLLLDELNAKRSHKDRYGRTLAYAYLENGTMLNRELIRQGYAQAYTLFPFRHIVEFRRLEHEARSLRIGLWSRCPVTESRR